MKTSRANYNTNERNDVESSPLLPKIINNNEQQQQQQQQESSGKTTFSETVINLMKLCMGTGTLALPFAAQKGGLVLNVFGLIGITLWNIFSIHRLILSLQICERNSTTKIPPTNSIFSKVAWYAFGGEIGIHLLDICLVTLFLGIIVSYEDAAIGFVQDTPFSSKLDSFVIAAIIFILSLVPDMSYLAKISASGLFVLAFTILIVAIYGTDTNATTVTDYNYLWPQNGLTGISNWFGCTVFGFGTVPFTYNYYESMKEPSKLLRANSVALSGVLVSYLLISYGLLLLYPTVAMNGDIVSDLLPTTGIIPTIVRLSMVVVIILTSPLIVFPCGMIVEGKIIQLFGKSDPFSNNNKFLLQVLVRSTICISSAIISISIPGFVYILSFVGCCAVSLLSFVIPPLLHLALVYKYENNTTNVTTIVFDIVMLVWGITAMIISSTYTFQRLHTE